MTEEIEPYWEGLRPPRDPEPPQTPKPPHNSCDDHLQYRSSELVYANLEDKQEAIDIAGNPCIVFKPRWYELHRLFWWLFIANGHLSNYQWTVVNTMNGHVRASKRVRWGPWV